MQVPGRRYGHIRVEGILGQGGMGDVYLGYDEALARRVALKVMHPDARLDGEAHARLIREARTLSQLDHPNICRIYDFIEDGDADVLVLELIDGRTLEQAVAAGGLSLAEKLRIARDVASVLVAAHRAGILHRDLKPENVMLTKSGQVKVLDFGLARWVEEKTKTGRKRLRVASSDDAAATAILNGAMPDVHAVPTATAWGVTIGTPLYMSPEQARGETLTTASDIYSFGLMLQTMFTGHDPYPDDLRARDVMVFAARGQSLSVNGVRRDVAALIKALKAFAPSDRPTAADALRRIEQIIETPKRVVRNTAAAVAVLLLLLGVWKYTTDLRRAESEARKRRSQADALIGFMLGDLRKKLEPVGKLDILDDVGTRALDYMASLDPKTLTPDDLARNATALSQLGEVRMKQGSLDAAVVAFQKALAFANEARLRSPGPANALAAGTAHFWIGNALLTKGDAAAALIEMKEYRRVADDLAARYPKNDDYQLERAFGHSNVAYVLEMSGDLAGSVDEYRVTETIKQARAAANPRDAERAFELAVTLNSLGSLLQDLGRFTEARGYFEREFAIFESLVRLDPKHATWRDRLANSHSYMAGLLETLGDTDAAEAHRSAALSIYRDLAANDPANTSWRRNVAISFQHEADVLRIRGRVAEALKDADAAEAEIAAVLSKDPQRPSWRNDQAMIETVHARVLHAAGRDDAARAKAQEAVVALGAIARTEPRLSLAEAYLALGDAEAGRDRDAAKRSWRSAAALLEPHVWRGDAKVGALYAQAMIRLGRIAEVRGVIDAVHRTGYRQSDFESTGRSPWQP